MRAHEDHKVILRLLSAVLIAIAVAAAASVNSMAAAAQQTAPSALDMANKGKVSVQIVAATPGLTIELALNGGKIADTRIANDGTGSSVLDVANIGKTQAQVFIEICENGKRVRVLLQTSGVQPTDDKGCDRKPVGVFWTDRTTRIVINVKGGSMTVHSAGGVNTKLLLVAGGAGAATVGVLAAGGTSSPTATSSTPTATAPTTSAPVTPVTPAPVNATPTTPTTPTTPATPPYQFLVNRTYNNLVTRGRSDCAGFSASANTQLRFTAIDPQSGMGTFMHIHSGTTTLNYTVQSPQKNGDTNATLVAIGTVTFGTTGYQLRITVGINGSTSTITEEFSCGNNQMTVYAGSGSLAQ